MNTPIGANYESAAPWNQPSIPICKRCNGEGEVLDEWEYEFVECPVCEGLGYVEPDYEGD